MGYTLIVSYTSHGYIARRIDGHILKILYTDNVRNLNLHTNGMDVAAGQASVDIQGKIQRLPYQIASFVAVANGMEFLFSLLRNFNFASSQF
jgi:hypothetical protein